jgi:hypothetical protein
MEPSPAPPAVGDLPPPAATDASTAEHRAALDIELFAHCARALAEARESRPKNTFKAYDPKQKEWREFCPDKSFEDGELVTKMKVIWFLRERSLSEAGIRLPRSYQLLRQPTPPSRARSERWRLWQGCSYAKGIIKIRVRG